MTGVLTTGAAFLLGLAASGHCLAMCGGVTAALGLATARDASGRIRLSLLLGCQIGRVVSYSLAGLLLAGALGGVVAFLDVESVRRVLRVLAALALLFAALVAFGFVGSSGSSFGRAVWGRLAPLGRRFLPINSLPRAFAFGTVWGWMPRLRLQRAAHRDGAGLARARSDDDGGVRSRHDAGHVPDGSRVPTFRAADRDPRRATGCRLRARGQRNRHGARAVVRALDFRHPRRLSNFPLAVLVSFVSLQRRS